MSAKIKLFETVLGIHEKGAASLTSSERSLIEQETRALLNAASRNKQAGKAPEGFEAFLSELQTAENADEAYEMILKFVQKDEKPEMGGKPEMGEPAEIQDKEEEVIEDLDKGVEKLEKLEDEEHKSMPEKKPEEKTEKKPEKKPEEKSEKKTEKKDEDKGDLEKDKKELMAKIQKNSMEEEAMEEEAMDEEDADKMAHIIPKMPATAEKVKVRVTSNRNLLVYFDGKPLFHAVPSSDTKKSAESLRRLANKVYGWVVYEGVEYALQKCGAKLLAGVDSDIETVVQKDIGPADEGVTESGDDLVKDQLETPDDDVRDEAEFDTQETHTKVEAGVDDDVTVVTEEKPMPTPSAVTDKEEDVIEESKETPEDDVRDEADVDFKNVEASYKKLYASRAREAAKKANDDFVKKFIRAFKVASQRMALNYDEHPYKAASMDVLTDAGFDQEEAQELTEIMASEGHSSLISQLLDRTASLMKKSDEYLSDLESDLNDLKAKPVEVERSAKKASGNRKMRKAASEGNFALSNVGTPSTRSASNNMVGGIRAAVGGTRLGNFAHDVIGQ